VFSKGAEAILNSQRRFGNFFLTWHSQLNMNRKKTIAVPPHTKRGSDGLQKTSTKNRVSFKIITQNNKNVIFIGFDGQFDLKNPKKN
jgi:hypothetical protein